jgi:predicted nucleotidyltransferase
MIELPRKEIATFCRTHHIARLSVFGSALTEDFGPDSDVDFLVEFEPGHVPGLIRFAGMELELTAIIGRKADLRTPAELSTYVRDDVMAAAIVQYAR